MGVRASWSQRYGGGLTLRYTAELGAKYSRAEAAVLAHTLVYHASLLCNFGHDIMTTFSDDLISMVHSLFNPLCSAVLCETVAYVVFAFDFEYLYGAFRNMML